MQEIKGKEIRLTLRAPNGLKPDVVCDEQTVKTIGEFLRTVDWEILRKEDETHAAEIDKAIEENLREMFIGDDPAWKKLSFTSAQGPITFKTQFPRQLSALFEQHGWHAS